VKSKEKITGVGPPRTILVASWYIWWERREAVKWERVAPADISTFFNPSSNKKLRSIEIESNPCEGRWSKTSACQYKLNVDALFPNGQGAAATIIRNHKGKAVAGGACDASSAEAMALIYGYVPPSSKSKCIYILHQV
jgi:hypothetical protein